MCRKFFCNVSLNEDLQASEMKKEEGSRDPGAFSPLEGAALDLCGADWRKKYRSSQVCPDCFYIIFP